MAYSIQAPPLSAVPHSALSHVCAWALAGALVLIGGCGPSASARAAPGEVAVGAMLPDVLMTGLTGPARRLSAFRGKPLVINVWASWCAPCRQEMPSLERLSRLPGSEPFNVIGISTDERADVAKSWIKKTGTTFAQFIDDKQRLENLLGADKLPLTVLVDANGKVLAKMYGEEVWDSPRIRALLAAQFRLSGSHD